MDSQAMLARSEKQAARAAKTQSLATEKAVKELMRLHPWLAAHFLQHGEKLVRQGQPNIVPGSPFAGAVTPPGKGKAPLAIADGAGSEAPTVPAILDGPLSEESRGSTEPPAGGKALDLRAALSKPIHRQYGNLIGLPQCDLRSILTYLEPSCLHPFALRGRQFNTRGEDSQQS